MKKILVLVLVALLAFCGVATAEMDYSSMTDDELHTVIDEARIELAKRECVASADQVIFEQDGVTVYLTGEDRISNDGKFLYLGVVIINENDYTVTLMNNSTQLNGWMSFMNNMAGAVAPGAKAKGELQFKAEGTDVTSLDDLQEITIVFDIFDKDTPKTVNSTEPITIHFNAD